MVRSIKLNSVTLKVYTSKKNTHITNSFKIKRIKDMKCILNEIKSKNTKSMAINNRTNFSMINEWRVHNLLYTLGIKKVRTKDVDLNIKQPWYVTTLYTVLSPLYLHFK